MDSTVARTGTEGKAWGGGNQPLIRKDDDVVLHCI